MAVIYYPKGSLIAQRDTLSASYETIILATDPNNAVIYFDPSNAINTLSASVVSMTASHALVASNAITTSFAVSSSYLQGGTGIGGMAYFEAPTSWSVPTGVLRVRVIAVAGGNANQPSNNGGHYAEGIVNVAGTASVLAYVGAGGLMGQMGTASYFGSLNTGISNSATIYREGGPGGSVGGNPGTLPWIPIMESTLARVGNPARGTGGTSTTNGTSGSIAIYW